MNRICVTALALMVTAGAAHGAIEYRIRYRTQDKQTLAGTTPTFTSTWSGSGAQPAGSFVEFAVQARSTTPGEYLGGFDFDIAMLGESEAAGQLWISRIRATGSNDYVSDAVAWPIGAAPNPGAGAVGQFGVAASYAYLPNLQAPKFNGFINVSDGSFTNNPAVNEIGLIGGLAAGADMLGTPGVDEDFDGNPDTFTGPYDDVQGFPIPEHGATAPVDPLVGDAFFGGNGNWIDLYHFRYTNKNAGGLGRALNPTVQNFNSQVFSVFQYSVNDVWVTAIPGPSSLALMGIGGLLIARRRR